MLCFIIGVSVLLSSVFCSEDNPRNNQVVSCSENFAVKGNGELFLEFKEKCQAYYLTLYSEKETSILKVISSVHALGNISSIKQNESNDATDDLEVKMNIYELTKGITQNYYIHLAEWQWSNISENDTGIYLTRTSSVRIIISFSGNWSNYILSFAYKEIEMKMYQCNSSTPGLIKDEYKLNTVSLYRMMEAPKTNRSSIQITLNQLDTDTAMGEYLLIGAGTEPFEDSTPLFISQPKAKSTFYVDSTSAYVVFVSSSSPRKNMSGDISILWERTGTEIPDEDDITEGPLDLLNSAPICFYNLTSALMEFNKSNEDDIFKEFRQNFAEMAKTYLNGLPYNEHYRALNASSVKLYKMRKQPEIQNGDVLYAIIQVTSQGKSLLTQRQLKDIILIMEFERKDDKQEFKHKIGQCPRAPNASLSWTPLIYGLVPVFGFFFLMIWAWRQKVFEQSCSPQKKEEEKVGRGLELSTTAQPNVYVRTMPKVEITQDNGRRQTIIPHSPNQIIEEENTDEISMIDISAIPSTSRESGSARHLASYPSIRHRPDLQPLIDKSKIIAEKSHVEEIQKNEKEHLYDSLNIDKTDETKL